MALGTAGLMNALRSHAEASGVFERVLGHEPKSAPGRGLTYALWIGLPLVPVRSSGLTSVSVRVVAIGRIFSDMLVKPEDDIDPTVFDAADSIMGAYCGDFTLGGLIRSIDIFGENGIPLSATPGYVDIADKKYRSVDTVIPMIINDLWVEAP